MKAVSKTIKKSMPGKMAPPKKLRRERANSQIKPEQASARFAEVRVKLFFMHRHLVNSAKTEMGSMINENEYAGVSDEGDIAELASREYLRVGNNARQNAQLKMIEDAVDKIDAGTYGICEECSEQIPAGRLLIVPFAVRCVECQANHELTN